MLRLIELEGLLFFALSIYILFRSTRPERGLWRITAARSEKLRSKY